MPYPSFPSPNKASMVLEACKEVRTEACLLKNADASVFVLAKYPLDTGSSLDSSFALCSRDRRTDPGTGVLGSRAHTAAFSRAPHLVFCRLVPMCGFQDGDELSVLGVGPAANA